MGLRVLKPFSNLSGLKSFNLILKFQGLDDQNLPKGHLHFQRSQFSTASRVKGLSKFKVLRGLLASLKSKGPVFPRFQGAGSETSTRASEFFQRFQVSRIQKGPQCLKNFSNLSGLKNFRTSSFQVSGGLRDCEFHNGHLWL